MYLPKDLSKYWVIDIEADSLNPTVVWCMAAINAKSREEHLLVGHAAIKTFFTDKEDCYFVGHNIIGYDAPSLSRILKVPLTIGKLRDTVVYSMVYNPSFDGGHSLENWGEKLTMPKGEFNDFSHYSDEMGKYCLQDTRITCEMFVRMIRRMLSVGFSEQGLEIEHRAWHLIKKQEKNGFWFDIKEATVLYGKLREIENDVRDQIYVFWPPSLSVVAEYKKPYKKGGTPTANYLRHCQEYKVVRILNDRDAYEVLDDVYFNIGSPPQRISKLLELGWKPREFTKPSKTHPQGQPKATEKGQLTPSLVEFVEKSGKQEVRLIAQWIEYNARANMVNTWIEAYNENTHCIHGSLWMANTLRYRHSNPNSANIPGTRYKEARPLLREEGAFTYEARALWGCRDRINRRLVGVDAKGIQLRVLAHYLNNKEFTDVVINGDPHAYNQEIGGFPSRDLAKTFIYAFFLGAGDGKVGQIIRGTAKDGRDLKRRFIERTPGLKHLLGSLKRQVERTGRIVLCDGTPVIVERPHTVLAYLLQGDESRIMKQAAILMDLEVRKRRLDVLKVGDIHDEFQNDVLLRDVEEFSSVVCPLAFSGAGSIFNYNVPIGCEAKVGLNWANTH